MTLNPFEDILLNRILQEEIRISLKTCISLLYYIKTKSIILLSIIQGELLIYQGLVNRLKGVGFSSFCGGGGYYLRTIARIFSGLYLKSGGR